MLLGKPLNFTLPFQKIKIWQKLFMNLTGTIIYSNESIIHIPSKASDETYLKKYYMEEL